MAPVTFQNGTEYVENKLHNAFLLNNSLTLMNEVIDTLNRISTENVISRTVYEMMAEEYEHSYFDVSLSQVLERAAFIDAKKGAWHHGTTMDDMNDYCDALKIIWNEIKSNKYLDSVVTVGVEELVYDVTRKVLQGVKAMNGKFKFGGWTNTPEGLKNEITCELEIDKITSFVLTLPSKRSKSRKKRRHVNFIVEVYSQNVLVYTDAFLIVPAEDDIVTQAWRSIEGILDKALIFILDKELKGEPIELEMD